MCVMPEVLRRKYRTTATFHSVNDHTSNITAAVDLRHRSDISLLLYCNYYYFPARPRPAIGYLPVAGLTVHTHHNMRRYNDIII